jgi:SAM-dependent methyltransferase
MQGQRNYVSAIEQGHYELQETPRLYDATRIYWENELTKRFLSKHLPKISSSEKIRVLDLGCGPGQGFKLLSEIAWNEGLLLNHSIDYVGLDINQSMIQKGQQLFGNNKNVSFINLDLRKGLDSLDAESFDLYFSSYGTLSHLSADELDKLLQDIVGHTNSHSLVVLDLLGRCSLEWTSLWGKESVVCDYTMSWLYPKDERAKLDIETFPMTFWTGQALKNLASNNPNIKILDIMDRSILMGRHIDTEEYRLGLQPIRSLINSLFDPSRHTNFEELIINKNIVPNSDELGINHFFYSLINEWNTLVEFCQVKVTGQEYPNLSNNLSARLSALENVIELTKSTYWKSCQFLGDSRASVIEPQLAYCLRDLENEAQPGIGIGHGLLAILEVKKAE